MCRQQQQKSCFFPYYFFDITRTKIIVIINSSYVSWYRLIFFVHPRFSCSSLAVLSRSGLSKDSMPPSACLIPDHKKFWLFFSYLNKSLFFFRSKFLLLFYFFPPPSFSISFIKERDFLQRTLSLLHWLCSNNFRLTVYIHSQSSIISK